MMKSPENFGWQIKPVFPLLYMILFALSVASSVARNIEAPAPDMVQAVVGDTNAITIHYVSHILTIFVSIYIVIYYIHLEILEHQGTYQSELGNIPNWMKYLEFFLRLILASVIALKIIQWTRFADLFQFLGATTFIILLWAIFVGFFMRTRFISYRIIIFQFLIFLLSIVAFWLTHTSSLQKEYAMILVCIVVVAIGLVALICLELLSEIAAPVKAIAKTYIFHW